MRTAKSLPHVALTLFLIAFAAVAFAENNCGSTASGLTFPVTLAGNQFGGNGSSTGFGTGFFTINPQTNTANVNINTMGLGTNITSAGLFNNGTNVVPFTSDNNTFDENGNFTGTVNLTAQQVNAILANPSAYSFNVSTGEFPNGAVSGALRNATTFGGTFSGANVVGSTGAMNGGGSFSASIAPNMNGSGSTLFYTVTPTGIGTNLSGLTLNQGGLGASGTPFLTLSNNGGALTNGQFTGSLQLTDAQAQQLMSNPSNFFVTANTSQFPSGAIRAQFGTNLNEVWFPVAGSVRGATGNLWTTDLRVYNGSQSVPATVTMELYPLGGTNTTSGNTMNALATSTMSVLPRATNAVTNAMQNLFPSFNGIGSIRLTSDQPIIATERIYDANGTTVAATAQAIRGLTRCDAQARGILVGLAGTGNPASSLSVRTNVGFFNPNPVAVTVHSSLGGSLGTALANAPSFTLQPYELRQQPLAGSSGLFTGLNTDATDAVLTYEASAPIFAYSSLINNANGDAHLAYADEDVSIPGVSQADIASIVITANQGEVAEGQMAASKATNSAVQQFAQQMVTDHTNALQNAQTVFSQNGIQSSSLNATSQFLQSQTQQEISNLNALSGTAFDRAYMQAQVTDHQHVLQMIDNMLLPSSNIAQVTSLLQSMRATVAQHLASAQTILSQLP